MDNKELREEIQRSKERVESMLLEQQRAFIEFVSDEGTVAAMLRYDEDTWQRAENMKRTMGMLEQALELCEQSGASTPEWQGKNSKEYAELTANEKEQYYSRKRQVTGELKTLSMQKENELVQAVRDGASLGQLNAIVRHIEVIQTAETCVY